MQNEFLLTKMTVLSTTCRPDAADEGCTITKLSSVSPRWNLLSMIFHNECINLSTKVYCTTHLLPAWTTSTVLKSTISHPVMDPVRVFSLHAQSKFYNVRPVFVHIKYIFFYEQNR